MLNTSYHAENTMSNPEKEDVANIWAKVNHGMSKREIDFLTHTLRVLPAIIDSLAESMLNVLSVDIIPSFCTTRIHIYYLDIPMLKIWASLRGLAPDIRPHGEKHQVVYTVGGVEVFALLSDEDMGRYFPV